MPIDILRLAEIIGALGILLGVVITAVKFVESVKKQNKEIEQIKYEQTLQMYAIRGCLDGLHQKGCNGKVTDAIERVDKYLNKAAHDQIEFGGKNE